MSYIKFSTDLFLEKIELNRFKKFLDDDAFRKLLINTTSKFGIVDNEFFANGDVNNEFTNALVSEDTGLTIKHNAIFAIDANGDFIVSDANTQIEVTPETWYWVKIAYTTSSKEKGLFTIDVNGNLVGNSDAELLSILRGQPNFPSKIKFLNSVSNLNEYTVLEVIDDQNAILDGSFSAESDLELSVIGTFTPSAVPLESEKNIFQYDSCTLTLVAETVDNTPPTKVDGEEFFIARVGSFSGAMIIQDKRTEVFKPKSVFDAQNLELRENPLMGVESIKHDHAYTTKQNNLVYLSWCFRSTNWTVNTNLNIVTLNGGNGGKYKDTNSFTDGDFDGWRLYTKDGSFIKIVTSVKTGSQINLYVDRLDIDKFSDDGGDTFTTDEIVITPDAEEIEISFVSSEEEVDASISTSDSQALNTTELPDTKFVFPINTPYAVCPVLAFNETYSFYTVKYRYKKTDNYSESYFTIPNDTYGYYTESAFDSDGKILNIVVSNSYSDNVTAGYIYPYSDGIVRLKINGSAYKILIDGLVTGDLNGVESIPITTTTVSLIDLVVGQNKKHVRFVASSLETVLLTSFKSSILTLNKDIYINLNKTRVDNTECINGNKFLLQFLRLFDFNGFTVKIVTDYNPTGPTYTLLKEISFQENELIRNSVQGLTYEFQYTGAYWRYVAINDIFSATLSTDNFTEDADVDITVSGYQPFRVWYNPLTNMVQFKGSLQKSNLEIATAQWGVITENFWPSETIKLAASCIDGSSNSEIRHLTISSSGVLSLIGPSDANAIISFDGLSYYLD